VIAAFCAEGALRVRLRATLGADMIEHEGNAARFVLAARHPATWSEQGHAVSEGQAPMPNVTFRPTAEGLEVLRGGFGGRPAYTRAQGNVVLASTDLDWMIAASRALGWPVSLDGDQLAVECLLGGMEVNHSRGLVAQVHELEPGSRAVLTARGSSFARLVAPALLPLSERDAPEAVRAMLLASVERATAGQAQVGVLTGGGLDSGALLAVAHGQNKTVAAFAMDFAGPGDDRPHLARLCATLGVHAERLSPEAASWDEYGHRGAHQGAVAGLPFTWPSGAAETTLLARARAWGATRVLTGAGADQLFDGDPEAASDLLTSRGLRAALTAARGYDGASWARAGLRVFWPRVRPRVPLILRKLARKRRRVHIPRWAGQRLAHLLGAQHERAAAQGAALERSPDARMQDVFFGKGLARVAALRLQQERASGVLRVDPYLDHELCTLALSLPPRALVASGVRRGLLREALRGLVPEPLRQRADKASFAAVHRALLADKRFLALSPFAQVPHLADLGIVEPGAFAVALASARARPDELHDHALLHACLCVEAFVHSFERGVS
jgi:asparagine synthase (glutamine-hydrolysing)